MLFTTLMIHKLFSEILVGMVSFFDFIVAANGHALKDVDGTFIEMIKEYEDKPLPLTLYNIKNHSTREITLTPSRNWPGEGMLGVTIRFDSFYKAEVLVYLSMTSLYLSLWKPRSSILFSLFLSL